MITDTTEARWSEMSKHPEQNEQSRVLWFDANGDGPSIHDWTVRLFEDPGPSRIGIMFSGLGGPYMDIAAAERLKSALEFALAKAKARSLVHGPLTDDDIEACASAAHEVNRAYCMTLGDYSQPTWAEAPDWQKKSARDGVRGALDGNTPEMSHASWLAARKADGWTWGPVKDPEKKQHPCFVPFADLPPEQREKDRLYVETVRSTYRALHR